jgi:hypothetical protein
MVCDAILTANTKHNVIHKPNIRDAHQYLKRNNDLNLNKIREIALMYTI